MAIDHYAICEHNHKYCYLGAFYEGDVQSESDIEKLMNNGLLTETRLNNSTGVYYMLRLCAFMRKHHSFGVRVVNESEFWDIKDVDWVEDKLT